MTPDEIGQSGEKLEEVGEPWGGQWTTGYRSWKLKYTPEREPRLGSVVHGDYWEPGEEGEVLSDWRGEEQEGVSFERSSKGLYSLRSPKEVESHGYAKEGIMGAITPYGEVIHGERGYRSSKAKVAALFKASIPCYVCGKPSRYVVRNDERFTLCEVCLKRLRKLVEKKGYTEEDIDYVLNKLAEIYGAEIVEKWEE